MSHSNQSDENSFAAMQRHDKRAFTLLYDRYWELVYKKAFSYLHDTDTCMRIVNDIFVSIWEKREVLNIITFKSYVTSAARYRVYNAISANNSSKLTFVDDYQNLDASSVVYNDAESNIQAKEFRNELDVLLDQLPERCKEIFLLSRIGHLSNTEIAEKLSISKRAVENQISLALKYLKPRLKQYPTVLIIAKLFILYTKVHS